MNAELNKSYVVATRHPWNVDAYETAVRTLPGDWHLITDRDDLTPDYLSAINPRFVFFMHWSWKIPPEIFDTYECVMFHPTDLPFGRGGSPYQNLISRGIRDTKISAFKVSEGMDEGPVFLKRDLQLDGSAAEIFSRAAGVIADMIAEISRTEPVPVDQEGEVTTFKRRTPAQSEVTADVASIGALYDHIRMLDAEGYPAAFIELAGFRLEFSDALLDGEHVTATATIRRTVQES